jgi:hypothetical protein
MNGFFGSSRGNYGNPAFHSFTPNKSSPLPANALNNVQQPDYPLLFDQYTGNPMKEMAEMVWQTGIMDKSEFLLTDILPLETVPGITVQMSYMTFDPKLMDTNPEWSQAKLVSFSRRQKRKRLQRRGLQIELEQGFASEEAGRDTFNHLIEAVVLSQRDTLSVDVLLSLQNAPIDTEELYKKDPRWKGQGVADAMADEIWFHGIMQKVGRPFEQMDSKIRANMAQVNGDYDTLIVPSRITGYAKSAMNKYLDFNTAGPAGPALSNINPDNADNRGLYPGMSGDLIIPLKPSYEQSDLTGGHSLMSSPMAVGEYYRCFSHIDFSSQHWTPDNQAVELYDETDSSRKKIALLEIVQHSGLFDEEGKLRPMNELPYTGGELKLDNTKMAEKRENGIYDMFTEEDGVTTTTLFGQISPRFLHPRDVVEWARQAVQHLEREVHFTSQDFKKMMDAADVELSKDKVTPDTIFKAKGELANFINNAFPRNAYANEKLKAIAGGVFRNLLTSNLPSVFVANGEGRTESSRDLAREALLGKIFGGDADVSVSHEKSVAASHLWTSLMVGGHTESVSPDWSVTQMEAARKALKLTAEQKRRALELHSKGVQILRSESARGGDEWELLPESLASEGFAQKVFEEWKANPSHPPSQLPGNPESPEHPASLEVLSKYFGPRASLKWPTTGGNVNFLTPLVRSQITQHFDIARMSEEHGSTAYDVMQTELQSRGSVHLQQAFSQMSIGLAQTDDERRAASNAALINPRRQRSVTFNATDVQGLLNQTGNSFVKAWEDVQKISSGLVRLFGLLFLSSEVHEETITRWANTGLALPFQGVIFRPNITHFVSGAIACKRGRANLGYMAIGKGNFTYGSDPGPQSIMSHYTFYSGGIIEKPYNVSLMPAITVDQYLGGKGCRWIDFQKEIDYKSDPEESMYGLVIPLRAEMPFVTCITGSTWDLQHTRDQQLREEPYFPQALRFRMTTGTLKMLEDASENEQTVPTPRNYLCLPGKYWFRMELEFNKHFAGKGHFWNTDCPQAKAIRSGGMGQYPVEVIGNDSY